MKKYSLTSEHRAKLRPWAEKWIANAMSCKTMDEQDRAAMREAINGLYDAANLERPRNIVFVASPLIASIASGFAAGIWWLREQPAATYAATAAATRAATYDATADATVAATDAATDAATRAATYAATRAATYDATYAATYDATDAATYAATDDATYAATDDATDAATDDATVAATRDATDAATCAATAAATRAATYAATAAATRAATYAATAAATRAATYAATVAATDAATDDATVAATDAATDAATRAATADATAAATRAATADATDAATRAATVAATVAATDAATADATDAATDAATYAATVAATDVATQPGWARKLAAEFSPGHVNMLCGCAQKAWRFRNGGNHWSSWVSFLSFFRHVAKLDLPIYDKWQHYEAAAIHGSWRYMHAKFCIVSDRPELIRVDEANRPHCDYGPSHRWRDGWELFHWHGVRIEPWLIRDKHLITPDRIEAEPNAELRRVMLEIHGFDLYIAERGAKLVDQDSALDRPRQLLELTVLGEPIRVLQVENGTLEPDGRRRKFHLGVPSECNTPHEAVAWSYGRPAGKYREAVRT